MESGHRSTCKAPSIRCYAKQPSQLRKATLYILGSVTVTAPGQRKWLEKSQEKKACRLKLQVAQIKRCPFQLKHGFPNLLTACLRQAVRSRTSSLRRAGNPAKLVKRVWRVGKLYQEIAQKNPSIKHLPRRILRGKKQGGKEESY